MSKQTEENNTIDASVNIKVLQPMSLVIKHQWFNGSSDELDIDGSYSIGGAPVVYITVTDQETGRKGKYAVPISGLAQQCAEHFEQHINATPAVKPTNKKEV